MTGDDRQLLARLAGSSPAEGRAALAALYARHAGVVLRFLERLLPDPNDAEDVLQDTFLTAARRAGTFRGEDLRPWLFAIAGNRVRDALRGRRRRARRERSASRSEAEVAPTAGGTDEEARLERALASVSATERAAVELRHVAGLTHAQVAAVLGVSLRTAQSWSARGLERLRERMGGAS